MKTILFTLLFALFLVGCNSSKKAQESLKENSSKDSSGTTENIVVGIKDSSEKTDYYSDFGRTGDTMSDRWLKIIYERNLRRIDSTYGNSAPVVQQPITIERQGKKLIINPGTNAIKEIQEGGKEQSSYTDSGKEKLNRSLENRKYDSVFQAAKAAVKAEQKRIEEAKEKQSSRLSPVLVISCVVGAIILIVLFARGYLSKAETFARIENAAKFNNNT